MYISRTYRFRYELGRPGDKVCTIAMNIRLTHKQDLVENIGKRDIVIDFDGPLCVH